jgi:hypothetical protein
VYLDGEDLGAEEREGLEAEDEVLDHATTYFPAVSARFLYTATPKISAKHVQSFCPRLINRATHQEMVDAGFIVPYRITAVDGGECDWNPDNLTTPCPALSPQA